MAAPLLAGLLAALAGACSGDVLGPDGGPVGELRGITIAPQNPTLTRPFTGQTTLRFTATGTFADGTTRPLGDVKWELDSAGLGSIDPAGLFTSTTGGGSSKVIASKGSLFATTVLSVKVKDKVLVGGATLGDLQRLFQAPKQDLARAPAMLYPAGGTMIPFNMQPMLLQWSPGDTSHKLFGLRIVGQYVEVTVAATTLQWRPAANVWSSMILAAKGGSLELTLHGAPAGAGPVLSQQPHKLLVSTVPVSGTIYYWAAGGLSSPRNGIIEIQAGTSTPKDYYNKKTGAAGCTGCHAVSRDGRKMLLTEQLQGSPQDYALGIDVQTKSTFLPAKKLVGDYFSFSPMGDRFVSSYGGHLTLHATASGAVLGKWAEVPTKQVSHPDWSPTADKLALVIFPDPYVNDHHFCQGSIAVADITSKGFGPPKVIAPSAGAADNNYYPTISPDGAHVAFVKAKDVNNNQLGYNKCDLYANPGAKLQLVPLKGGPTIALARANATGRTNNSWPKWAPSSNASDPVYWLAFSSTRDYGRVLINSTKPEIFGAKHPQIWVTAIRRDRLKQGLDPSHPAFWLPGQQTDSGNHIPSWTQTIK